MKVNEFKCDICENTYEKELTEEEEKEQLGKEFPGFAVADCGIVCDDCFKKEFEPIAQ